jgi:hypothetical protein
MMKLTELEKHWRELERQKLEGRSFSPVLQFSSPYRDWKPEWRNRPPAVAVVFISTVATLCYRTAQLTYQKRRFK